MDLDEVLAIMAAPIYAARLSLIKDWEEWQSRKNEAMQESVKEARMIWEIAHAVALKRHAKGEW
jgi:hypothetical protein